MADASTVATSYGSEIPASYADIKCHRFVQDIWDALPDSHKNLGSLYVLLSSANKMQSPDQSLAEAVDSFLHTFRAEELNGKIETINLAVGKETRDITHVAYHTLKNLNKSSIECLKDFQAFANVIPDIAPTHSPERNRRTCLLRLPPLCFPVLPFQADVIKVWSSPTQANPDPVPLAEALAIEICMSKRHISPKNLLDPASKKDLFQSVMQVRALLNSAPHKSFLLKWRKRKYPQELDRVLDATVSDIPDTLRNNSRLPTFMATFPIFSVLNTEFSSGQLFAKKTANNVIKDFARFLGTDNTRETRSYELMLDAFAQTTAIQNYVKSSRETFVKTETEPDPVFTRVTDIEEVPNPFQTNIGKGAAVPTLTLQDNDDTWTASVTHRPVGGTWEIEVRDRYPHHVDIDRMFNGFPIKDSNCAWQVAEEYATDNDKYAVHPNVVIGDVSISDDGLEVLKSWVEHHRITTPLKTLKEQWISQIKAEYEEPMNNRKPPSAQAWQVVRLEREHCYGDAQFHALKGKYGVIPIDGAKQRLLSMGPAFAGVSIRSDEERNQYIARYGQQQFDDYAIECIAPDNHEKTLHVVPYCSRGGFFNGKLKEDDPCHFVAIDVFVKITNKWGDEKWQSRPHLVLINEVPPKKQALMNYLGNYFTDRSAPAADDSSSGNRVTIKIEPQDD